MMSNQSQIIISLAIKDPSLLHSPSSPDSQLPDLQLIYYSTQLDTRCVVDREIPSRAPPK